MCSLHGRKVSLLCLLPGHSSCTNLMITRLSDPYLYMRDFSQIMLRCLLLASTMAKLRPQEVTVNIESVVCFSQRVGKRFHRSSSLISLHVEVSSILFAVIPICRELGFTPFFFFLSSSSTPLQDIEANSFYSPH